MDGWRLVVLGLLILTLRRMLFVIPMVSSSVLGFQYPKLTCQIRLLPALDGWKEAAFVGYFGPIGEPSQWLIRFD